MLYAIGALAVLVLAIIVFLVSRLKIAKTGTVILVEGSTQDGEIKVVPPGGRTFVIPMIQSCSTLSLHQRRITLDVDALDVNKVAFSIRAVAMVKVGNEPSQIRAAADRFNNREEDIEPNAKEILLGALRSIMGQMSVVELVENRDTLAKNVTNTAKPELLTSGLVLDSLNISEISDKDDYLKNLGIPQAEEVRKAARIAHANAERDANDAEVESRLKIAEKRRELDIREAELRAETDKASAISAAAGPLAKAAQDRDIAAIEQATAEERAILREKELDTEVRKPADARRYEIEREAEAEKARRIAESQAEAEQIRLRGEAEKARRLAEAEAEARAIELKAAAEKSRQMAEAEAAARAIQLKGEAEAEAARLKGEAEASALDLRAEALAKLTEVGVTEMIVNKLPEIAHELAAPMGNINDLNIISTDGASALPKAVGNNMAQLDLFLKNATGIDIATLLAGKAGAVLAGKADEEVTVVTPDGDPAN